MGTDGSWIVYPVRGIAQAVQRARASQQRRTLLYVGALGIAAFLTCFGLLLAGYGLEDPISVVALGAAAAIGERSSVRLTKSAEQSISVLPTLLAAVLFGPLAAAVVGAASMLGDPELVSPPNPERAPRLKWAT